MKTYEIILTEEEANLLGSALVRATADAKKAGDASRASRIAELYLKLDTCREVIA